MAKHPGQGSFCRKPGMGVCICSCMCVHVCMYIYIYVGVHVCVCMLLCVYVRVRAAPLDLSMKESPVTEDLLPAGVNPQRNSQQWQNLLKHGGRAVQESLPLRWLRWEYGDRKNPTDTGTTWGTGDMEGLNGDVLGMGGVPTEDRLSGMGAQTQWPYKVPCGHGFFPELEQGMGVLQGGERERTQHTWT